MSLTFRDSQLKNVAEQDFETQFKDWTVWSEEFTEYQKKIVRAAFLSGFETGMVRATQLENKK